MNKSLDHSYEAVMARKGEIMRQAIGIDYAMFEFGKLGFDYEKMMNSVAYSLKETSSIQ